MLPACGHRCALPSSDWMRSAASLHCYHSCTSAVTLFGCRSEGNVAPARSTWLDDKNNRCLWNLHRSERLRLARVCTRFLVGIIYVSPIGQTSSKHEAFAAVSKDDA